MGASTATLKKGAPYAPSGIESTFSAKHINRCMRAMGGFANSLPVPIRRLFEARLTQIFSGIAPADAPDVGKLEPLFVKKNFALFENDSFTMPLRALLILGAWCSSPRTLLIIGDAEVGTGHEDKPLFVQGFAPQGTTLHSEERRTSEENLVQTVAALLTSLKAAHAGKRSMAESIAPFRKLEQVAAG